MRSIFEDSVQRIFLLVLNGRGGLAVRLLHQLDRAIGTNANHSIRCGAINAGDLSLRELLRPLPDLAALGWLSMLSSLMAEDPTNNN